MRRVVGDVEKERLLTVVGDEPGRTRLHSGGEVHRVVVRTGPYGEDGVPVLSGLKPTDWVVAAGAHLLLEGQEVAPIDRDNRPVRL